MLSAQRFSFHHSNQFSQLILKWQFLTSTLLTILPLISALPAPQLPNRANTTTPQLSAKILPSRLSNYFVSAGAVRPNHPLDFHHRPHLQRKHVFIRIHPQRNNLSHNRLQHVKIVLFVEACRSRSGELAEWEFKGSLSWEDGC